MDAQKIDAAFIEGLDSHNDETLRAGRRRINELLAARDGERKAQTLATIRRLIRENDLDCELKKKSRKRGRPRKPRAGDAG